MNNSCTTRRITAKALIYNSLDKGHAVLVASNLLISTDPTEQFNEMKAIADRNPRVKAWAATSYISPIWELNISDEELTEIAIEALSRIGIGELNQYKLEIHGSTKCRHIHGIANRVNIRGVCTVEAHNIGKRFGEAIRDICRERGIPTDVEIGIKKKGEMLDSLIESLHATSDFKELLTDMDSRGYKVELSTNKVIGISGMRITRLSDINHQTERIYKTGYTLSQITRKLKIAEIKNYYDTKSAVHDALNSSKSLIDFKIKLSESGYKLINVKGKLYVKNSFQENISKSGFFYKKNLGFSVSDLNENWQTDIDNLPIHHQSQEESLVLETVKNIDKTLNEFLTPTYVTPDDELTKKKKKKNILNKRKGRK